ncbi:hypothetical protein LLEC1_05671 [Akanthomyces lecanii]|uniref:Bromo domain-containing protein n=1 Tax=Cordyceps confragosa TaxID=2714763 RepID=A0A179I090_CORDF|nr:hypothetical protein LLEC1_05671 [Akanthomyces lecanii]
MEFSKSDAPAPASAPVLESKLPLSPPQPEQKLDANGLAVTEPTAKPVESISSEPSVTTTTAAPVEPASSTTAPILNGSGSSSEHIGTNGVSLAAEPSPDKPISTEPNHAAPPAQQPEEKHAAPSPIETAPSAPTQQHSEIAAEIASPKPVAEESTSGGAPREVLEEEVSRQTSEKPREELRQEPKEQPKEDLPKVDSKTEPQDTKMAEPAPIEKASAEPTPAEPTPTLISPTDTPNEEPSKAKEAEDVKMEDSPRDSAPTTQGLEQPPSLERQDSVALPTSEVDLQPASMSQLNIETQPGTSPIVESVEISMSDAPAAKIAREREDDSANEEPAAKRARTEPEEDKPMAEPSNQDASVADTAAAVDESAAERVPSLDTLPNWNDPEANSRPFSTYQRREIRKTITRLKKTKGGQNFRDAVIKLWPHLREAYLAKIEKPMDLSELDRNVRDGEGAYATFGEFKNAASLIYMNALNFNGATHDVTFAAFNILKALWEELLAAPAEEPPKPKSVPKVKPSREPRAVAIAEAPASRRTSTGPRGSPSTDADAKSVTGDRRGSTATEGDRPKRTVRAPKPKDIDYTTKPSRKKLKPELQFAAEVLTEVMSPKYEQLNTWFLEPVDAEGLNIPDYYSIIKKPMDLGKVSAMLSAGDFANLKDFDKHVRLVFENCYSFNGPPNQGNPVSQKAAELERLYTSQMKTKDAWLAKFAKANAPASADGSDEDDEDEDAEDDIPHVDNSKEIQELQAKLDEETKKLHAMFVPGANQSMIDIQKGIVDMVQHALIKAVASAGEVQPKNDKSAKKARGAKGKGAGGRKSTGAGPGKKAGGGKKGAAKKTLTAADKDHIANAINDLESTHLDRAIDIIKKDTGQNENNDGELELDIDQLSNDALLKLWELCKKVLPGFAKDSSGPAPAPEPVRAPKSKTTAGKPKKNKPMSAQEQEARIAQLTALRQMYKDGGEGSDPAAPGFLGSAQSPPLADSSDDSDSEEE